MCVRSTNRIKSNYSLAPQPVWASGLSPTKHQRRPEENLNLFYLFSTLTCCSDLSLSPLQLNSVYLHSPNLKPKSSQPSLQRQFNQILQSDWLKSSIKENQLISSSHWLAGQAPPGYLAAKIFAHILSLTLQQSLRATIYSATVERKNYLLTRSNLQQNHTWGEWPSDEANWGLIR